MSTVYIPMAAIVISSSNPVLWSGNAHQLVYTATFVITADTRLISRAQFFVIRSNHENVWSILTFRNLLTAGCHAMRVLGFSTCIVVLPLNFYLLPGERKSGRDPWRRADEIQQLETNSSTEIYGICCGISPNTSIHFTVMYTEMQFVLTRTSISTNNIEYFKAEVSVMSYFLCFPVANESGALYNTNMSTKLTLLLLIRRGATQCREMHCFTLSPRVSWARTLCSICPILRKPSMRSYVLTKDLPFNYITMVTTFIRIDSQITLELWEYLGSSTHLWVNMHMWERMSKWVYAYQYSHIQNRAEKSMLICMRTFMCKFV
jgi:hypothetical protein